MKFLNPAEPPWEHRGMALFSLTLVLILAIEPPSRPRHDLYGDPLPDGAVARLGTERFRRVGRGALAILPGGQTYREVHSGAGVTIRDCKLTDGRLLRQRNIATESVGVIGLSSDGSVLATHHAAMSLDLWDAASGKHLRSIALQRQVSPQQFMLSPDGRFVGSVSRRGIPYEVVLWDGSTGQRRTLGKLATNSSIVFTGDGSRLIGADGTAVRAWDTGTGKEVWAFSGPYSPMPDCPPLGRSLLLAPTKENLGPIRIDTQTGKRFEADRFPPGFAFRRIQFGPDDRTLITWTVEGDGAVWDLAAGKETVRLAEFGHPVVIMPDGKSVLGMYPHRLPWDGGVLQQWDLVSGRTLLPDSRDRGHGEAIGALAFSTDGLRLASSSSDNTVRVWDLASSKSVSTLRAVYPKIALVAGGKGLVTAESGRICLWDSASGKKRREFDPPRESPGPPPHVLWLSIRQVGTRLVAAGSHIAGTKPNNNDLVAEWDLATGRLLHRRAFEFKHNRDLLSPNGESYFSRDGELVDIVTARVHAKLHVPAGQQIGSRDSTGFQQSRDGRLVAAQLYDQAGWGKAPPAPFPAVRVWETATGAVLVQFDRADVGTFALSPDGRRLATSDAAGVTVWDLATSRAILHRSAHRPMRGELTESYANALAFSPDGRALATGHPDSTILLWDVPPASKAVEPTDDAFWERVWSDLAASDPRIGYTAVWRLTDAPSAAIAVLKKKLTPASEPSTARLTALITGLDSDQFTKREAASKELARLGELAEPALRDALKGGPSAEVVRRIKAILEVLNCPPPAHILRQGRAVHALAVMGSAEARALLVELAKGDPTARLTRDAQAVLAELPK